MLPGRVSLRFDERTVVADVLPGRQGRADVETVPPGPSLDAVQVRIDGEILRVTVAADRMHVEGAAGGPAWAVVAGDARWVYYDGRVYELEVQREGQRRRSRPPGSLAAPMPATVRQIRVGVGDAVARGDTLIVLEAMKMELPVRADADGTVAALHCAEGELVQPGRPLIELTPRDGA